MATSREEILEQVKGALSEKLGIDESEITEDASFEEDLGADSLDLVELDHGARVTSSGSRSRTRTPSKLTTVGKAIDYVVAHQLRQSRRGPASSARLIAELPRPTARAGLHARVVGAMTARPRTSGLEFLGDSVLELAIARPLFDRFPDGSEGRLAKIRAHVVSRRAARCGREGRSASATVLVERAGRRPRTSSQRHLREPQRARRAARGGDRGRLPRARLRASIEPAIVEAFDERIEYARTSHVDYKTELQEALARSGRTVHYTVLEVEGPPHDRRFVCAAHDRRRAARRRDEASTKKAARAGGRAPRRSRRSASPPSGTEPRRCDAAPPSGRRRENAARCTCARIRMRGFKSFPDRVEVTLEPGVAVVVGPNGSGKSNIADAIVWAAGSLTPSELRAEKPDDVLFAGVGDRKPAEHCEVELVFDNEDGGLAPSSTSRRSRSRAGSYAAARGSTSSTARRCAAPTSSSSSPTSASARRCTRSSARARSSRCSPRSRRIGGRSSRRPPGSASSSAAGTAPS